MRYIIVLYWVSDNGRHGIDTFHFHGHADTANAVIRDYERYGMVRSVSLIVAEA